MGEDVARASIDLMEDGRVGIGHDLGLDTRTCIEETKQVIG